MRPEALKYRRQPLGDIPIGTALRAGQRSWVSDSLDLYEIEERLDYPYYDSLLLTTGDTNDTEFYATIQNNLLLSNNLETRKMPSDYAYRIFGEGMYYEQAVTPVDAVVIVDNTAIEIKKNQRPMFQSTAHRLPAGAGIQVANNAAAAVAAFFGAQPGPMCATGTYPLDIPIVFPQLQSFRVDLIIGTITIAGGPNRVFNVFDGLMYRIPVA